MEAFICLVFVIVGFLVMSHREFHRGGSPDDSKDDNHRLAHDEDERSDHRR